METHSIDELLKQITDLKAERDDLKMTLESSEKLRVIQQAEIERLKVELTKFDSIIYKPKH